MQILVEYQDWSQDYISAFFADRNFMNSERNTD